MTEMHGACSLAYLVECSPVLLEELLARVFICVAAGDQEVEMGGVGPHADVHPMPCLRPGRFRPAGLFVAGQPQPDADISVAKTALALAVARAQAAATFA